jgi:hypothetical protein
MFMQDYVTETCGDCGTETCDSHICSLFMQDYGTETCGGYPGSLGYLYIDAQAARPYIKYLCAMLCLMLQSKFKN